MATDSQMPPPNQGGGNKLAIVGILLLLGAGAGIYFLLGNKPHEETKTTVQKLDPATAPRPPQPEAIDIEIPAEQPDLGVVAPPPSTGPRRIIKYVDAPGGNWDCAGNIEASKIQAFVGEHRTDVRACYERKLKQNTNLQGSVNVMLKVGNNGSIAASQVSGSLKDNDVFSCVRSVVERWHLPAPEGGQCAVVRVPFNFTPSH